MKGRVTGHWKATNRVLSGRSWGSSWTCFETAIQKRICIPIAQYIAQHTDEIQTQNAPFTLNVIRKISTFLVTFGNIMVQFCLAYSNVDIADIFISSEGDTRAAKEFVHCLVLLLTHFHKLLEWQELSENRFWICDLHSSAWRAWSLSLLSLSQPAISLSPFVLSVLN